MLQLAGFIYNWCSVRFVFLSMSSQTAISVDCQNKAFVVGEDANNGQIPLAAGKI
jgi:hypothetical protein